MSELVADFVDDLPCSEEKVALDVVAVHRATREEQNTKLDAVSVVDASGAGVGDLGKSKEGRSYGEFFMWEIGTSNYGKVEREICRRG